MTALGRAALTLMLLALPLVAAPARAGKPAEIAITPASPGAVLILKAPNLPPPPTFRTAYRLSLQTYDPAGQKMVGGPFGGSALFQARPKDFVDGYLILEVKPGTYAFQSFSQQDYWALCFNGGSLQFTVRAGEVLYLGDFDAARHAMELQTLAVTTGRVSTRGSNAVHFFDTVTPPLFAPTDEAELARVAAMVKARMPKTNVAPKAAAFSPARFGTGRDLFGLQRICGGYYQGKAKGAKKGAGSGES
jgi:hypothetical protein